MLADLDRRLGALELRSLFAGALRRRRRGGRDPRRRRRHRRPGLGRDDAAHVHPLGRAARLRHRGGGGHPGPGGRTAVGHLHREGPLRLRAAGRRARRAPAGAHLARSTPSTGARPASPRSTWSPSSRTSPARWRSTRRTSASTPTGRRGPAASTSTRPTRRSGSPTFPPASWCPARTSGASTRTRPRPCRCSGPSWPSGSGPSTRPRLDQLSGDRTDNAWGNQIRSYVMAPVPAGQGPAHQRGDRKRRGGARRRSRRLHRGRAAPPGRGASPAPLNRPSAVPWSARRRRSEGLNQSD